MDLNIHWIAKSKDRAPTAQPISGVPLVVEVSTLQQHPMVMVVMVAVMAVGVEEDVAVNCRQLLFPDGCISITTFTTNKNPLSPATIRFTAINIVYRVR